MPRPRHSSNVSNNSSVPEREQELGSMYDYLAKVILLGPSGSGKSCILHRFVQNEWRVLSAQTIGVEFSSKIVKVGTGSRRKRIKLQLWDTAGTERFRSVSRSYYRGAAGALLVYDITSYTSFSSLSTFLTDARALASPNLTVLLAGNKQDLENNLINLTSRLPSSLNSASSRQYQLSSSPYDGSSSIRSTSTGLGTKLTATVAPEGREVSSEEAMRWASANKIPVFIEVSALTGENIDEVFSRLARMILTKIELGEIDPDDPQSGIQYGDSLAWGMRTNSDGGSVKSSVGLDDIGHAGVQRKRRERAGAGTWRNGMREWEEVFRIGGSNTRRSGGCC